MKNPCVAFVYLPTVLYEEIFDLSNDPPHLAMPLGIMYLSASLKQNANVSDVFLLDYSIASRKLHHDFSEGKCDLDKYMSGPDEFIVETAKRDAETRVPDIIAVSLLFSTSRLLCLQIIEHLSKLWPDAAVVVGGNHATNDVQALLSHPDVDFVVRGEAELAFPEFVKSYSKNKTPEIKGVYSKNDLQRKKTISEKCDYFNNLDEIPFPDWDLIDVNSYSTGEIVRKREFLSGKEAKMFTIMTSRGCPFQCTFCASHTVHGRQMRYRSTENVIDEMMEIYNRFGANLFCPEDDLFTASKKRVLPLLKGIKKLPIPNLMMEYPSALSVATLDYEVIDALRDAGMNYLYLAIESGSPYVQKHIIKKRVNLDKARTLVKYANDNELYTRINFIVGFPNETMEQIQETIDYAKTLGADWNVFSVATPLIGSEMFDEYNEMGVLNMESRNYERTYLDRGFDTNGFTAKNLSKIVYRANLEINFIHNRQMLSSNWEQAIGVFTDVLKRHPSHIFAKYQIYKCLENLGMKKESKKCFKELNNMINTMPKAKELLFEYGDLVPDLTNKLDELGQINLNVHAFDSGKFVNHHNAKWA